MTSSNNKQLRLSTKAYAKLKEMIINGAMEPGRQIREIHTAEMFNISRTPVRKAIQKLADEGFVVMIPKRGAFVKVLSSEEAQKVLRTRESLERQAVEEIVAKNGPVRANGMIDANNKLKAALDRRDFNMVNRMDAKFHLELVKCADNFALTQAMLVIMDYVHWVRTCGINYTRVTNPTTYEMHNNIITALQEGNYKKAWNHLHVNIDNLRKYFGLPLEHQKYEFEKE